MKRSAFIIVTAPLVLTGCSYSPSTGWHWDEYSEPEYADRWLDEPPPVAQYGVGVSPRIDLGDINVCNINIGGVSVCAPR